MVGAYWQYQLPLWLVASGFLSLLLIPMEIGFQLGMRQRRKTPQHDGAARSDVALNAMLALLGLT